MNIEISDDLLRAIDHSVVSKCGDQLINEFLEHLINLTGNNDEVKKVISGGIDHLLRSLFEILKTQSSFAKGACLCLVNISATENGLNKIMSYIISNNSSTNCLLQYIHKETPEIANAALILLCNLTREKNHANKLYETFVHKTLVLELLMKLFITLDVKYEKNYNYISYLLSNLCQLHEVRIWLMDSGNFEKLLSFISHEVFIRKAGVISLIKNCCFELEKHEWLLNEDLDLLPRLLLPLAGPEQFDEEDNEKLPLDLQYLPDDKERESVPNLRLTLLQALTQLCAKKCCREIIRDQGTYLILRELHKWEPNMEVKLACENLVDILIKTEDEIGTENFHDLNVPEDLIDKFEKMDEAYLS